MDAALAERLAQLALVNVRIEYPHKLDHLINGPEELLPPRTLHPAFYGSYDWHSAVHMHWTLARLLRLFAHLPAAGHIAALLDTHLNEATIAGELAYLDQPNRATFERPYGWAWLLKLDAEFHRFDDTPRVCQWRRALAPLALAFAERFVRFMGRSDYPVRVGTHGNSAFAMLLALDWCEQVQHPALRQAIHAKARQWFGRDARYPAAYEPGGNDFLSGGLCEAALMHRVLDGCDFDDWWQQFRPADAALAQWLTPASVADRADPQIVHLDGLNLSRVWCWRALAANLDLPENVLQTAIDAHLQASLPHVAEGDFGATHWLASFALLALTEPAMEPA
jgi:hypothetical protein